MPLEPSSPAPRRRVRLRVGVAAAIVAALGVATPLGVSALRQGADASLTASPAPRSEAAAAVATLTADDIRAADAERVSRELAERRALTLKATEAGAKARAKTLSGQARQIKTTSAKLIAAKRAAERREAERRAAERRRQAARDAAESRAKSDDDAAPVTGGSPRAIAKSMMASRYGWGSDQFVCYDHVIMRESEWNPTDKNPSSGAYGIPQALPGSKMASAGADWRTNPATQIKWSLGYIKERYGTPCGAWSFHQSHGWY